jgi:hypothetical protein
MHLMKVISEILAHASDLGKSNDSMNVCCWFIKIKDGSEIMAILRLCKHHVLLYMVFRGTGCSLSP